VESRSNLIRLSLKILKLVEAKEPEVSAEEVPFGRTALIG
jgi:hypothetical protein